MTSPFFDQRLPALLAEVVRMYEGAGRPLAGIGDDELDAQFLTEFAAYAAHPGDRAQSRALNDVAAEYVLRHRDAPLHQTFDRIAALIAMPGYERRPAVLLAFGRASCIPARGAVLMLRYDDEFSAAARKRKAAESADFDWLILGHPAGDAPGKEIKRDTHPRAS
jgi:hypothetical protein